MTFSLRGLVYRVIETPERFVIECVSPAADMLFASESFDMVIAAAYWHAALLEA